MKSPNILWYTTDQQRFDTISALGNDFIHTPNIDRLAARGTAFTKAYCQSPVCTPSRASFLTGMYPSALAVNQNGIPTFPPYYADRLVTNRLRKEGYFCGLVGKLHIASAEAGQEVRVDDGYEYFEYSHDHKGPNGTGNDYARWLRENGHDPEALLEPPVSKSDYQLGSKNSNFGGLKIPDEENDNIPAPIHQTRWCTEKAMDFLQKARKRGKPWLLSVNPFDPHPPYDPPWEYYKRQTYIETLPGPYFSEKSFKNQQRLNNEGVDFQSEPTRRSIDEGRLMQAAYYAMIEQIDTEFGRILDWLDETGEAENTIIIFTSDHGEMLGDHGLLLKGCRFYEGLVRVPLIISWPGHFKENHLVDELVQLTDIVPTLYEASSLSIPYYVQGKSLAPLLKGEQIEHRAFVRSEAYGIIDYPDQTYATMYRDKRWKLITYHEKGISELFDLNNDPWEMNDLSENPEYFKILIELQRASFDATVASHPPHLPRIAPY